MVMSQNAVAFSPTVTFVEPKNHLIKTWPFEPNKQKDMKAKGAEKIKKEKERKKTGRRKEGERNRKRKRKGKEKEEAKETKKNPSPFFEIPACVLMKCTYTVYRPCKCFAAPQW